MVGNSYLEEAKIKSKLLHGFRNFADSEIMIAELNVSLTSLHQGSRLLHSVGEYSIPNGQTTWRGISKTLRHRLESRIVAPENWSCRIGP